MKIVAISGSLRERSSNAALLKAAMRVAPPGFEFRVYQGLAEIPPFNPDLDVEPAPPAVQELRRVLGEAEGFLISTPEYARGIPGALKNALDWIVSSAEFSKKPVVLLNAASTGGENAQAALALVLTTMDAEVLRGASLMSAFLSRRLSPDGTLDDPEVEKRLRQSLEALREAIERHRVA